MNSFHHKLGHAGCRFRYGLVQWPLRAIRLVRHLFIRSPAAIFNGSFRQMLVWSAECALLVLDCLFLPEWYEIGINMAKLKLRELTEFERKFGKEVFGDTIEWDLVRLDESAHLGPRQYHFAYVSFFTINSFGALPDFILIHELVHIWQFQRFGSVYIIRALLAQHSREKYNYGGIEKLVELRNRNGCFADFNFEQQADIISDYFLLKKGRNLQWCCATPKQMDVFEYYASQIHH